jgi:sulfur carrier protein ThiS
MRDHGEAVQITVVLFGTHAKLLPSSCQGRESLDMPAGSTVEDVLDALAVPVQGRSFLTLDGERVAPDKPLHEGAELRVIVPLGGG